MGEVIKLADERRLRAGPVFSQDPRFIEVFPGVSLAVLRKLWKRERDRLGVLAGDAALPEDRRALTQ